MNKIIKLIYLLLLLILNFSCFEKKSTVKETSKLKLVATSKTDTLKFKSGIRAIFQDRKGNYWFGSHNEGVSVYNGKYFEYFTTNEGLRENQILSIQEDENGRIWFESQNGVSSYDGKTIQDETSGITENYKAEWMKSDTDLWFGAGIKEGVYRFDGHILSYLAFPKPKTSNPNNLYGVTSFSKGKNNMIWFGTYAGVFGYNGKEFKIINDETLGLNIEVEPLHIRSILEDSKGRLWIGNNGIGVLLMEDNATINFSEKNQLIHPSSTRRGDKSKPGTLEHVFAIEEDSEGNIWFGDRDTGAWKYDGKKVTNYSIANKYSSPMIWTIYKDNKNNLLFGMSDGSIFKFNGKAFEKQF